MYKTVTGRYQVNILTAAFVAKKELHIFISIWLVVVI
jgi:hypothetical protein